MERALPPESRCSDSKVKGVLITEASVPAMTPMRSGRIFAQIQAPVRSGIALANPNEQDTSILYHFTDSFGRDFGAGSFTLAAHHQMESFFQRTALWAFVTVGRDVQFHFVEPRRCRRPPNHRQRKR